MNLSFLASGEFSAAVADYRDSKLSVLVGFGGFFLSVGLVIASGLPSRCAAGHTARVAVYTVFIAAVLVFDAARPPHDAPVLIPGADDPAP